MGLSSDYAHENDMIPQSRSFGVVTFEYLGYGYIRGGTSGLAVTTADVHNLITVVTTAQTSANLQAARAYATDGYLTREGTEGYTIGGYNPAATGYATCDKVLYATSLGSFVPGLDFTQTRVGASGLDHQGYEAIVVGGTSDFSFGGGTVYRTTSDKMRYTVGITVAGLTSSIGRCIAAGMTQRESFGYIVAGYVTGGVNTAAAYKTSFITELTSAVSGANATVARRAAGSIVKLDEYFGNSAGYICGGYTTGQSNLTDEVDFVTDTTSAKTSLNLNSNRFGAACLSAVSKGILFGGNTNSAVIATAEGIRYNIDMVETYTNKADLTVARVCYGGGCGGSMF